MTTSERNVSPLQRAWASGVFDARVSFPATGYIMRFEGKDEQLMRRFHEIVGVGEIVERDKKDCAATIYMYRTTNMDDTRELLLFVAPLLGPKRLAQAGQMIAKVERSKAWQLKHPEKLDKMVTKKAT